MDKRPRKGLGNRGPCSGKQNTHGRVIPNSRIPPIAYKFLPNSFWANEK